MTFLRPNYASLVLSDSEVAFLEERKDVTIYPFLNYVLFIGCIEWSEKYIVKFSGGISSRPAAFLFLSFSTSASSVNCPSLISSWLSIIFWKVCLKNIGWFQSRFLKFFFHWWSLSSWLVAFSFALEVLFLLITLFTVWYAIQDCLSSKELLIL